MGYVDKLIALDLKIAGVVTWEEQLHELFNTYKVDSFEDLAYHITDERVMETITLGEALLILNINQ